MRKTTAMRSSNLPATLTAVHVDDSDIARAGVKALFAAATPVSIEVIGEARTATEALTLCTQRTPHVVLLEIRLGREPAVALCREIVQRFPSTRVLVLTSSADDTLVYEAVSAGAHGYLLKTVAAKELIEAVRTVAAGRSILDMAATGAVLRGLRSGPPSQMSPDLASLSRQQRRVLELVTEGATNKEIGATLGLSENTVRNYLVTVFEKLDVKTRAQAASLYTRETARSSFEREALSVHTTLEHTAAPAPVAEPLVAAKRRNGALEHVG